MTEPRRQNHKVAMKVPEFIIEPLEAAQAQLEALEEEAQRVFKALIQKGKASQKDFAQVVDRLRKSDLVHNLRKQDWHLAQLRDRLEKFREMGVEGAQKWRDKAGTLRAETLERLVGMQGKAVNFFGAASNEQLKELSRELHKLSRQIEKERLAHKAAEPPVSPG